jgi:hypothetical protein
MTSRFVSRAERRTLGTWRSAAALVLLAAWLWALRAQAAPDDPVALTWNAPANCSSAPDVLRRVRELTQSARLPDQQLRAEATIGPGARGQLHLKLVLRTGELVGERNIDGRSCDDLAGATAVVLALLLRSADPLLGTDLEGRPAQTDGSTTTAAKTATVLDPSDARDARTDARPDAGATESPPRADVRAPRRLHGLLQLPLASVGIGPFPRPGFGFSLGLGARLERWSMLAEGTYWLTHRLRSASEPGAAANIQRVEAALRTCRAFAFGRFELAPCARLAVQHLWARGTGAHIAPQTAKATWLAVTLGVQARYHIRQWFGVFAGLDAHLHTARPRLSIAELGSLGQLWPAALTISLGGEWIF